MDYLCLVCLWIPVVGAQKLGKTAAFMSCLCASQEHLGSPIVGQEDAGSLLDPSDTYIIMGLPILTL